MSYASTILADSPTGYWRCGDASGTLTDSSGAGSDLTTITGAITYSVASLLPGDPSNTAVSMSAGRASRAAYDGVNTLPFTVECWVKPAAVGGGTFRLFLGNQSGAGGWRCGTDDTGKWFFSFRAVTDYTFATGPTANLPYHVVFVCKTDQDIDLYVNGAFAETVAGAANPGASTLDFTIGSDNGGTFPYNGVIDEVALYAVALSAGQISAHYVAASALPVIAWIRA